ncbi:MAG: right-handed parallel beta-helix repeat-containing protein [Paracoccus sp. (in: a-proteobacteria)]
MRITDLLMALPSLAAMDRTPSTTITEAAFSFPFTTMDTYATPGLTSGLPAKTQTLRDFYDQNGVDYASPSLPGEFSITSIGAEAGSGQGGEILPLRTETFSAQAGRITTLDAAGFREGAEISAIKILSQSTSGQISINPDMSLALNLSEDPGNTDPFGFSYEITYANGDTQEVQASVSPENGTQEAGWAKGEFYMLEEDSSGTLVIEHGDNHRKVYVTGSEDGWTRAEIAAREGIREGDVTGEWLKKNPEYGSSEDMALATDVGMELWYRTTMHQPPTSNWLLFERGYEYSETNRLIAPGANGESELHPMLVSAYGKGADPIINAAVEIYQRDSYNVVVQNIDPTGFRFLQGGNLLLDTVSLSGNGKSGGFTAQNMNGLTLRNSDITDIFRSAPVDGADIWNAHLNRTGGAYISETDGLLIENNYFDHNGWGEGYDPNLSANSPQPPSMYSQNLYLQFDNKDVTVRDNILMRGSSFGVQVRSGGVIEDNAFIDNNAAVNTLGGSYGNAGPVGHYSLLLDNLVTSAGHKRVSFAEGALSMGIDDAGNQSSRVGNIVTHLADPNNPAEIAKKKVVHFDLNSRENTFFDDTITFNWGDPTGGKNIDGLDQAVLNQTTIQNFTADLLGKDSATIADLANYLRAQYSGAIDSDLTADQIIAYFRDGFGLDTDIRDAGTTLRFVPDDRGDGMRWDNRLNWDSGDLPGTRNGDSIDLGGNRVTFGADTVTVDDFIFGDYGSLKATSGRLNISGDISVADTGATLQIDKAGQVWMQEYLDSDLLKIEVSGGRFANNGVVSGSIDLSVSDNGQALLAVAGGSFDLAEGSHLKITGTKTKVGLDGADGDIAVIRMHDGASLKFISTSEGLGKLAEFRSGAFGETSDVTSGIHLDGTLRINLEAWEVNSTEKDRWILLDADQITGSFTDIKITGLAKNRDAALQIDYGKDEVRLLVSAEGTGTGVVRTKTFGEADFIAYTNDPQLEDLWEALDSPVPTVSDVPM